MHPVAVVIGHSSTERDVVVALLRSHGYQVRLVETVLSMIHHMNLTTRANLVLAECTPGLPDDFGRAACADIRIAGFPHDAIVLWATTQGDPGWTENAVKNAEATGFVLFSAEDPRTFIDRVVELHRSNTRAA